MCDNNNVQNKYKKTIIKNKLKLKRKLKWNQYKKNYRFYKKGNRNTRTQTTTSARASYTKTIFDYNNNNNQDEKVQNAKILWQSMYEATIRWHSEHQINYWKTIVQKLQNENEQLKTQLAENHKKQFQLNKKLTIDAELYLNEDFLNFMEITARHQQLQQLS